MSDYEDYVRRGQERRDYWRDVLLGYALAGLVIAYQAFS